MNNCLYCGVRVNPDGTEPGLVTPTNPTLPQHRCLQQATIGDLDRAVQSLAAVLQQHKRTMDALVAAEAELRRLILPLER